MDEYETAGHMSKIPSTCKIEETAYYLPHHVVRKEGSTTTKVRVGSMVRPRHHLVCQSMMYNMLDQSLQDDLFSILIRFRKHKFVISADIKQMYRQILIRNDQRKFQILWRSKDSTVICEYQLNTITYGMASALYLATRYLQQVAKKNAKEYPAASNVILQDFYMDDLLMGTESIQEVQELKLTLSDLLMKYGFELRKWASNVEHVVRLSDDESHTLPLPT